MHQRIMFKTNVFQRNILNEFNEDFAPKGWKNGHELNPQLYPREKIIFFKYVGEESKYISELDFYNAVKVSSDYPTAENVRDKEMK